LNATVAGGGLTLLEVSRVSAGCSAIFYPGCQGAPLRFGDPVSDKYRAEARSYSWASGSGA